MKRERLDALVADVSSPANGGKTWKFGNEVMEAFEEMHSRLSALEASVAKHETLLYARCSIVENEIRWYDNDGRVVASADFVMPPAHTVTVREALDNLKNFTRPLQPTETVADRVDVTVKRYDSICDICDGGPGNDCACTCPEWRQGKESTSDGPARATPAVASPTTDSPVAGSSPASPAAPFKVGDRIRLKCAPACRGTVTRVIVDRYVEVTWDDATEETVEMLHSVELLPAPTPSTSDLLKTSLAERDEWKRKYEEMRTAWEISQREWERVSQKLDVIAKAVRS